MADRKSYSHRRRSRLAKDLDILAQQKPKETPVNHPESEAKRACDEAERVERSAAIGPRTVKVGPSCWAEALPLLLAVYEDGNPRGRADAKAELVRMAELADRYVDCSK